MLREPALSLFLQCPVVWQGPESRDPRPAFLQWADDLCAGFGLVPAGSGWPYPRPADVPIDDLRSGESDYRRLVNMRRTPGEGEAFGPGLVQVLLYAQHDMLTLQLLMARYDPWRGSLTQAWQELRGESARVLDGLVISPALAAGLLGVSALLWSVADAPETSAYAAEIADLGGRPWTPMTETDLGPLWSLEGIGLSLVPRAPQRLWILITRPGEPSDQEANRRYNQPLLDRPSDFARLEAARHKFLYEVSECQRAREMMEAARRRLEERSSWLLHAQRHYGRRLEELGGTESLDFQENLVRGNGAAADFRRQLTLLGELGQTLHINRRNFALHAAALIAAAGAERVSASDAQERAAAEFLRGWQREHTDEIFRGELGRMQAACEQVEADLRYARELLERYEAVLHAAGVQLQIAGQREIAAISRSGDVDTGLVVASLAAVVVLELLRLGDWLQTRPYLSANLMLLAITGSFTLALLLAGSSPTTRKREWGGVASTIAFLAGALTAGLWELGPSPFLPWNVIAVLAGGVVGALAYGLAVQGGLRRQRARRRAALRVQALIDDAGGVAPDLRDLLEESPPQHILRTGSAHGEDGLRYVVPARKIARLRQRIGNASPSIAFAARVDWLCGARYPGLRLRRWVLESQASQPPMVSGEPRALRIQICTPLQHRLSVWFPQEVLDARMDPGVVESWRSRLSPLRWLRRVRAGLRAARLSEWQAPWLVQVLHYGCPVANRPIAACLAGLGRLEARLFGGAIGLQAASGGASRVEDV